MVARQIPHAGAVGRRKGGDRERTLLPGRRRQHLAPHSDQRAGRKPVALALDQAAQHLGLARRHVRGDGAVLLLRRDAGDHRHALDQEILQIVINPVEPAA